MPRSSIRFSPARALGALLAVGGACLVLANRVLPDESRWLGAATLVLGVVLCAVRETSRRSTILQASAAAWLVLLGGEVAVRIENARAQRAFAGHLIRWVDDPELRYDLYPSVPCEQFQTNAFGMADGPHTVAKPAGTFRVACLGDSVGADCSLAGKTACGDLGPMLQERLGRPVETLNFSVFGYNTLQEARSLELKAAAFGPDAIVVLYVVNDPFPDLAVSHFLPGHLKFEHLLYSATKMAIRRVRPDWVEPLPLRPFYSDPSAWDGVVVKGFDRIEAEAHALGAPVVVAIFPLFLDRPWHGYADIYEQVAAEARRHGFEAVDLSRTAYANVPAAALLKPSRDMIHPNAYAHELAAQAITEALARVVEIRATERSGP